MDLNLADKNFIISGSSRGIGKGTAKVLLEEGARVVLTGRDTDSLERTFNDFNVSFPGRVLQCNGDLNSVDTLDKLEQLLLSEWSQINGIIANAGAVKSVAEWNILEDDWKWYFDSNFNIAVRFVTRFIPHLIPSSGNIVFISSIAGLEDLGAPLPYSSSKVALTMYAKGLARKLAAHKIRVNTVAPGNIIFQNGNWDAKRKVDPEGIERMLDEKVPLKCFGSPDEIGNMVAFLLSEKASFITGSCFVVDGGQTLLFS